MTEEQRPDIELPPDTAPSDALAPEAGALASAPSLVTPASPGQSPRKPKWTEDDHWSEGLIALVEKLLVMLLAVFFAVLLLGYAVSPAGRWEKILRGLHANWRPLLMPLVPIVYRELRSLAGRVRKIGGVEVRPRPPRTVSGPQRNP